jgi:hypothetical protein
MSEQTHNDLKGPTTPLSQAIHPVFQHFPKLAAELQIAIWNLAIEPQIIKLDVGPSGYFCTDAIPSRLFSACKTSLWAAN